MNKLFFAVGMIAVLAAANAAPTPLPCVELDFNLMAAGDWKGKRFADVVPTETIKRVVRLSESGFAELPNLSGKQASYDAFLAHLLSSAEPIKDWGLSASEKTLAQLIILTKDGEILRIEIVGTLGIARSPSAILIHAQGRGARVNVTNFKYPTK